MATKLGIKEQPKGTTRDDFKCFGPVVTKDCEYEACRMADMGCFLQETVDSNKYFHAAVVQHKATGQWYLYNEWGRTKDGASSCPNFQFVACGSEAEAMNEFVKKCKDKNSSRGVWEQVGSKQRLVPKKKKDGKVEDLYTIRVLASRAVGLPDAKNIANEDAIKKDTTVVKSQSTKKAKSTRSIDAQTRKLFKDLLGGAITYARSSLVGGTIPAQTAIDDARDLLQDAQKRLVKVGDEVKDQVADGQLKQMTYTLYGMIPKVKAQGVHEATWILSRDNIKSWQDDLDTFETALKSADVEQQDEGDDDVMQGVPADVEWIPLQSEQGEWLSTWWKKASRNRHYYIKDLKIHGLWKIRRHGDSDLFKKNQQQTFTEMGKWNEERPLHQDKKRIDLEPEERKMYWETNTGLLFHGTKSVCVPGIIRENFRFPSELVGVQITGAMFGPGTYFADDYRKSAGYCSDPSSYYGGGGAVKGRHSFMFAVDTILGHPHVATGPHGYAGPPKGRHCVFGKAGASSVQNNEWIIFRKGRSQLRYLAEVSW